jgi:hypothetical protein
MIFVKSFFEINKYCIIYIGELNTDVMMQDLSWLLL